MFQVVVVGGSIVDFVATIQEPNIEVRNVAKKYLFVVILIALIAQFRALKCRKRTNLCRLVALQFDCRQKS